jgi:uncharacterized protein
LARGCLVACTSLPQGDDRRSILPLWATSSRFTHFYRLAINTRIAHGQRGTIRIGDEVEILVSEVKES